MTTPAESRVINRYANRKLYDTQESCYITLSALATLVREGVDLTVLDKETQRDLTTATLAQIIYEEEKKKSQFSIVVLRDIIRTGQIK